MQGPAYVNSISAIQEFRNALVIYVAESKQGTGALDLEIRRAFDWIAVDRAQFWRNEIRRAMDAVARAKDDLHNARTFKSIGDYTPSCVEERKALKRAEERLKLAEAKAEAVKKWTRSLQHELNEYAGRIAQFNAILEIDVPKALATLDRVLSALDRYVSTTAPRPMAEPRSSETKSAGSMAMPRDERPPGDEQEKNGEASTEQGKARPVGETAALDENIGSDVDAATASLAAAPEEARS
jgi:hypothetical protein